MISRLRRRHRWMAPGAIGLSIVGLGVAAAARPDAFVERAQPQKAASTGAAGTFRVAVGEAMGSSQRLTVVPSDLSAFPDLLAYTTVSAPDGDALPGGARLLGAVHPLRPTALDVPSNPDGSLTGHLVVYSLGHAAVVGSQDLARAGEAR